MRKIIVVTLLVLLCGCVKHHAAEDFDVDAIEVAAIEVFEKSKISEIQNDDIPEVLTGLNYESISIDKVGVYIKLQGFFAKESGLFIAQDGFKPNSSDGGDPSFRHLKGNVYSYVIKG